MRVRPVRLAGEARAKLLQAESDAQVNDSCCEWEFAARSKTFAQAFLRSFSELFGAFQVIQHQNLMFVRRKKIGIEIPILALGPDRTHGHTKRNFAPPAAAAGRRRQCHGGRCAEPEPEA